VNSVSALVEKFQMTCTFQRASLRQQSDQIIIAGINKPDPLEIREATGRIEYATRVTHTKPVDEGMNAARSIGQVSSLQARLRTAVVAHHGGQFPDK